MPEYKNNESVINSFVIFKGVLLGIIIMLIFTIIFALFSSILFRLEEARLSKIFLGQNIILLLINRFLCGQKCGKEWLAQWCYSRADLHDYSHPDRYNLAAFIHIKYNINGSAGINPG